MKKTRDRIIFGILILVIAALSILSGWALKERENYQRRLAHENLNNWARLSQDINGMILDGFTVENRLEIKENYNYLLFQHDNSQIMPNLTMDLRNYYYRLVYALTEKETTLTEGELEEGVRIFNEMNKDLLSLCQLVFERSYTYKYGIETGENWKFRKGLVQFGSDEYEQVAKEIQELSDQYVKELKAFFKEEIVVVH